MLTWGQFCENLNAVYDFSSIQFNLPDSIAGKIIKFGKSIPASDIYVDPKDPSYGRENEIHITVLYGLHTTNLKEVKTFLSDKKPFDIKLGKTSLFTAEKYDVLKIDVASSALHKLNGDIRKHFDYTSDYPIYRPHLTVAYLKKGKGKKYIGRSPAERTIEVEELVFSSKNGTKNKIKLGTLDEAFRLFLEQQAVSISLADYENSAKEILYNLADHDAERKQRLSTFKLDLNSILQTLQSTGINLPVAQAVASKNHEKIWEVAWELDRISYEFYKQGKYDFSEKIKKASRALNDFSQQLDAHSFTYEEAEKWLPQLVAGTQKNMQGIADRLQQAIGRIPTWHSSPVLVKARPLDKQQEIQAGQDAEIVLNVGPMPPSFTLFMDGEKIMVDDVLEASDEEGFFANAGVQADYFSLVQELRKPGSTGQKGRILTLYTARPVKDRRRYMDAKDVPANIFLTSRLQTAENFGADYSEKRDVWKVRIDSRYLVQTLDTPGEKQYQAVGTGVVPVARMELVAPAE